MGVRSRPRAGSLQFWPRKRAARFLHKVNWNRYANVENLKEGIQGFIAYKAGMTTAVVKNTTEKARTLNKQITVPVTILEIPSMKIFSIRFYKNNKVVSEIVVANDKELKRKTILPKAQKTLDKVPENYDDVRVIVYSMPKQTSIKKTPDVIELAVQADDKLEFVKKMIGKEITIDDFPKYDLVDVSGLTKGHGTQGPIQRFGLTLKFHKTEKGVRRPGSIGPWHPAHTMFRSPQAGQMGLFSRTSLNLKILSSGKIAESDINPKAGFQNYGRIKTNYLVIAGSVPGPAKRQLLLTPSYRPTKKQSKKKYEFQELLVR